MSSTEHGPLADTMWRLTELMPWFAAIEAGDPANRQAVGAIALRRLQDDRQGAITAQLAMTRSAMEHATQAASRLATARNPMDAAVAQAVIGLALAEFAAAPTRAWLEMISRLHACCMTMASESPDNSPPSSEAEAESPATRARTRAAAPPTSEVT
ncbi:hypothetical protein [Neoroseomonas soli]|uniref:Uncharacterized protein n=1 Tax=Neoroseomonas soli TaxID=1081025 RepID=A0A9X9WZ89_9PROT|nr:hypothetical protein [Neoroseomonas soli]MBR0672468.1 hypothetical protein [Neoroseomonas soli]